MVFLLFDWMIPGFSYGIVISSYYAVHISGLNGKVTAK